MTIKKQELSPLLEEILLEREERLSPLLEEICETTSKKKTLIDKWKMAPFSNIKFIDPKWISFNIFEHRKPKLMPIPGTNQTEPVLLTNKEENGKVLMVCAYCFKEDCIFSHWAEK